MIYKPDDRERDPQKARGLTAHRRIDQLDDISRYRTAEPHPRALKVPADLSSLIFRHPYGNLNKLVDFLIRGIDDPFEKARVLHDWTALNITYDWQNYISGTIPSQSTEFLSDLEEVDFFF
jgi:hypothetical protein